MNDARFVTIEEDWTRVDIFVSWAGRDSRAVALVLRRWAKDILDRAIGSLHDIGTEPAHDESTVSVSRSGWAVIVHYRDL